MAYEPEIVIDHRHNLTFRSLWRQHFNYGRGAFLFHDTNKRLGSKFQFDSAFYFSIFRFPLPATRACMLCIWKRMAEIQMANAVGFFYQALRKKKP